MNSVPLGVTIVALPYTSKEGFHGATTRSIVLGILEGGFKMTRWLFLQDHTQVQARNAACRDAVELGAEWLLFIDSDMDFPTDTLTRLKACDADIACLDMWARNWPSFRTVMRVEEYGPDKEKASVPVQEHGGGVERVDVCGMACTLIRTSLLRKMKERWPDNEWFESGTHGEDATFCFKAKLLDAVVKCDFGAVAGHYGTCRMAGQEFTRDARNQTMTISQVDMMRRMRVTHLPEKEGC